LRGGHATWSGGRLQDEWGKTPSRDSLLYSNSSVNYTRQDTFYIGESDLGSKSERGRGVICEKPSRR